MTEIPSPWLTVNETAEYVRRHPKTVLKWLSDEQAKPGSGLVGFQKTAPNGVWRIHRDDADAFLRRPAPGFGLKSA
ncbi:helix-turn-helix domain-containing protein [Rhodococcus erythropolis]|uniref:helix-turn-helix domain-containing protein n=1 Tax=Rhodococcus erythropolis TaxID=1833 RepID=UPI00294A5C8A|nr:helix-turn-helix domain-containing protein [Rhodococcus erythropolis]MDV6272438.1 helix-turn-helix domain-containing protein [Rhodococcus erythropolis]